MKKSSCSGEYGSVVALVAEMVFFGVVGVSKDFAVAIWSTIVFSNDVAVVEGYKTCRPVFNMGFSSLKFHLCVYLFGGCVGAE